MLGVTIAALTGSDSAPAKANEAKQKNDIGAARDQVYLFASNAQTEAYERIYVKGKQAVSNADVTASNASTEVSKFVKDKIDKEYGTAKTVGLATIVATDDGATITISTTDWKQEGNVADTGGTLTWKELTDNTPTVAQKKIGDSVNYSTSLNGVTLDDWSVFYVDVDGDYTYLILDTYLPCSAINTTTISGISTEGENGIIGDSATQFISAMTTKENWNDLVTNGCINGQLLNLDVSENVWAIGSPTIELFVDSWNSVYPNERLYISLLSTDVSGVNGYYIGDSPDSVSEQFNMSNKTGIGNTLFFPNTNSYWLSSQSASASIMLSVNYYDGIGHDWSGLSDGYAIRPVIKLPTSVINQ